MSGAWLPALFLAAHLGLFLLTGCTPRVTGIFIGGTDFVVAYEEPRRFNATKIEAHSVNAGVSVAFGDRCGLDILPLIVGIDSAAHDPTYAAATFWRCYLVTFP